MMNEILFSIEIIFIFFCVLKALKLGPYVLTAWIVIQALIANLFVIKQIDLFGFNVTASDPFIIGSLFGLNFLQEYYGKERALEATSATFFLLGFFAVVSQLHLLYQPSTYDESQLAFQVILSPSVRLMLASIFTFFVVQKIDIVFFEWLKKKSSRFSFSTRSIFSLLTSQLVDTILFSFVGLYGIAASLFDIILVSYMIKLITIFSLTFVAKVIKV